MAIYGLATSGLYKPDPAGRIMRLIERHPDMYPGLQQLDREELYFEIKGYIDEQERIRFGRSLITMLIPTLFISGIIAYLTSYYLVKPIEILAEDVESLGDGDFSKRLKDIDASAEIEYLQERFNQMLEKVENAFNSQEEFIQDAAHELRTPLASMKAQLDLMRSEKFDRKEMEDSLRLLSDMNDRLVKLSEDLLYLDRRKISKLVDYQLDLLIDDLLESLQPLAKKQGVQIKKDLSYDGEIKADPISLSRALRNIIENSIKYGATNVNVRSKLSKDDQQVELKIVDNGKGIPNDKLEHIFDRFYRGDEQELVDGNGLGLSIVQKILDDHNFEYSIKSKVGKGTTFIIKIPIV